MFCRKTISVNSFLDSFTVYESDENSVSQESFFTNNDYPKINLSNNNINSTNQDNITSNNIMTNNQEHKIKYKFITEKSLKINKEFYNNNNKYLILKGDPCSIIFQNISNYMSGAYNIWGKAKENLSVEIKNVNNENKEKYKNKLITMADSKQNFDDKMLEVFIFDNGIKTGLEKIFGGKAKKLYHGKGPMEVKFIETPKYQKEDKFNRIYFNLDGEFFNIVKPISLRIELNKDYCDGQIPFLIGNI